MAKTDTTALYEIPEGNPNVKPVEGGGMFGGDQLYGGTPIKDWIGPDTEFILHDAHVLGRLLDTEYGPAPKSVLTVSEYSSPDKTIEVSSLSTVIADKVLEKQDGDLPAVVVWNKVETKAGNDALVLQFRRKFDASAETIPE